MATKTAPLPVNPATLRWAREAAGHTTLSAAEALKVPETRLAQWERGEGSIPLGSLRKIADLYRRTMAFFFVIEPPAEQPPRPPDFRAASPGVSPPIAREMLRAAERRRQYLELEGPPSAPWTLTTDVAPEADLPRLARRELGVSLAAQMAARNEYAAFDLWRHAFATRGILVFQMSRVGVASCRGFSTFNQDWSTIVLNGADSPAAKCFTLMHELRHLIDRSGAVCNLEDQVGVERRCNAFAGELLMPAATFLQELGDSEPLSAYARLARRFNVSRPAAAIRLKELGLISESELGPILGLLRQQADAAKARQAESDGGPGHAKVHFRNLGEEYVGAMMDAYHDERISLNDLANHLEAKVQTIDSMEKLLISKRDQP